MNKALNLYWLAGTFLAILLLAAFYLAGADNQGVSFGQRPTSGRTSLQAYSLVGSVNQSSILLALVSHANAFDMVEAYATDGQQVNEWFAGSIQDQSVALIAQDGARFQATLTTKDAQGTLTLPGGSPLSFQLIPPTGQAGLYRAKQEVNGVVYLAGWILLADGRQAGVIESDTLQLIAAPRLDPDHPSIPLPDGGILTPTLVTPDGNI